MPRIPSLVDNKVIRPAESALALGLVSRMDLLRLKAIARLHARGLPPDVSWEDLLQEALTRVLVGSRVQPHGIAVVAFVAGIMRSLRTDHWRRVMKARGGRAPPLEEAGNEVRNVELRDPGADPERSLMAVQELAVIERLFEGDTVALQIIAGLREGLSAEEIRAARTISKTDYDSARRRMRRTLLREGLTCEPK